LVFPEPAPAKISRGPSVCQTASCCAGFSISYMLILFSCLYLNQFLSAIRTESRPVGRRSAVGTEFRTVGGRRTGIRPRLSRHLVRHLLSHHHAHLHSRHRRGRIPR